jgi:hypothetical protein
MVLNHPERYRPVDLVRAQRILNGSVATPAVALNRMSYWRHGVGFALVVAALGSEQAAEARVQQTFQQRAQIYTANSSRPAGTH